MSKIVTPMTEALVAYGIDPMRVPETVTITHDRRGLTIDIFTVDADGETILNEDRDGLLTHREMYPHPA